MDVDTNHNEYADELTRACRDTVHQLVKAFSVQDIEKIMSLFAERSTYCDVRGPGAKGRQSHGKPAIRQAFIRQFHLMGTHTFEAPTVVAEGRTAFASWTLVLGDAENPKAARFEGIDHFELDENAQVTLKKAWLKGQPRLARTTLIRYPLCVIRHPVYALFG